MFPVVEVNGAAGPQIYAQKFVLKTSAGNHILEAIYVNNQRNSPPPAQDLARKSSLVRRGVKLLKSIAGSVAEF